MSDTMTAREALEQVSVCIETTYADSPKVPDIYQQALSVLRASAEDYERLKATLVFELERSAAYAEECRKMFKESERLKRQLTYQTNELENMKARVLKLNRLRWRD